jgi:hypothetical protein
MEKKIVDISTEGDDHGKADKLTIIIIIIIIII